MGNQGSEYEVIKVMADSGASDHVAPLTTARHIKIEQTEASRSGLCYQAANGESISNIGQRNIRALTNEGEAVAMTWQIGQMRRQIRQMRRQIGQMRRQIRQMRQQIGQMRRQSRAEQSRAEQSRAE